MAMRWLRSERGQIGGNGRTTAGGRRLGGAVALGVALWLLACAASASAEGTVTRTFTAHEEAFLVPQGVTSVQVVAIGGSGGSDGNGTSGGQGAIVHGALSVTPGETLHVHVGGNGFSGRASWEPGSGGHASDVRTQPLSAGLLPDPRLIVAGAGGGAGGQGHGGAMIPAGRGGNAGESGWETVEAFGGEPGTQTAGGEGGSGSCSSGENGHLEAGGFGGYCHEFSGLYGGDGGDGYYGGGGGGAQGQLSVTKEGEAGGGGGSSLVPAGGTVGLSSEQPQVRISYVQPQNPPAVVTGAAAEVREFTATLDAQVNPEAQEVTNCAVEYGTTEAYGASAPCSPSPGSGIASVAVSAALTGLERATTYHFRIMATNASGTSHGADATFTTLPQEPPTVTGVSPSDGPEAGGTSVTITGTNLEGATAVMFDSTPAASFTVKSESSISAVSPAGAGTAHVTVTTPGGTSPGTGADLFSFVAPPKATTTAAWEISQTTATLTGSVTSTIAASACSFEYGLTNTYGSSVPCSTLPGAGTQTVTAPLAGLKPNTTYHFHVIVTTDGGTTSGADLPFTTQSELEYGRCIKVAAGTGLYGSSSCTTPGGAKAYAWYPAFGGSRPLAKKHFTLQIKVKTEAKLLTPGRIPITCKGASGKGEYSGNKTIANVELALTGCHLGEAVCTSRGAAAGEVVSTALSGGLGVITKSPEGPAKNVVGTYLRPTSGELVAAFTCGATSVTVDGATIGEVKRDAMLRTAPIKFVATSKGFQKPKTFEGDPTQEVPFAEFGEGPKQESALVLTLNQTDEEAVEVNSTI
jgi:hypothetical protein